jgi:phytoene dehydrogenase-like protein
MKKVVVIGAGIAGLSAGIYAQKCGFDVTILESHSIAGGICTAWRRKGYLFEGGMHWLTGSGKNESLHKMWQHIGALNDNVKIHYSDPFIEYNHKGTPIRFYRNVDKTEKHLLSVSPADEKMIRQMSKHIRRVKNLSRPIFDLRGVKVTKRSRTPLPKLFSALFALLYSRKLAKISRNEFMNGFSHEGLRNLLRTYTGDMGGLTFLMITLGSLTRGDSGFPEGGSLPFVERITDTFTSLGGNLRLNTRADRVVVENGKVKGVMVGNEFLPSDAVIVSADTMAIDYLFDVPLQADWLSGMRKKVTPVINTFVSFGIEADLSKYPHVFMLIPEKPIQLADYNYSYLIITNYAADPVYSPAGKTAITINIQGDTYDFWKKAKEENRYIDEKKKLEEQLTAALAKLIPETEGRIEVCDIATPLTYERYCGCWKGSWMTILVPGTNIEDYPPVVNGISGVYFAGQRMSPPGGLPMALMSARTAVQYLCRDTKTLFVSED